jgi:hypothetical protein
LTLPYEGECATKKKQVKQKKKKKERKKERKIIYTPSFKK